MVRSVVLERALRTTANYCLKLLLLFCLALPTQAQKAKPAQDPPIVRKQLFEAALLQNQFKESQALALYQEVLKTNPNHYLALWQSAVLSIKIGQRYTDETRKSAYYEEARRYADHALNLRPEGGEANYAAAVVLFSRATLMSARGRMRAFHDLHSYVKLATERRPDLPDAWELLGRWQYRVAHFNVLERLYSQVFLGGTASATTEEAIASLEQARRLAPQRLQFCYDLARMYRYQGSRRRAIALLREAEKIFPLTNEDLVLSRLCRQMLPPLLRADARKRQRDGEPPDSLSIK